MSNLSDLLEQKPTKTAAQLLAETDLPKGGRQLLEFVESQASPLNRPDDAPLTPSP